MPGWVSQEARRYLAHTEAGQSIRELARSAGCHPSTVLRQVRRVETRRDDPLVDGALAGLAAQHFAKSKAAAAAGLAFASGEDAERALEKQAAEALTWLARSGAVLAVADGMEKAVVLREDEGPEQKMVIGRDLAEAMALQDWIGCSRPGRFSRYHITPEGRIALGRLLAAAENRARARAERGFAEARAIFNGPVAAQPDAPGEARPRRTRYGIGETPLAVLSRLSGKEGVPFLSPDLVRAGERLREDFELAQVGAHMRRSQVYFCPETGEPRPGSGPASPAVQAAKARSDAALEALGPGLSDIALRCCCHLEGLETAERQLGWSARSGKVVLRIALQQLKAHYDGLGGGDGLIG